MPAFKGKKNIHSSCIVCELRLNQPVLFLETPWMQLTSSNSQVFELSDARWVNNWTEAQPGCFGGIFFFFTTLFYAVTILDDTNCTDINCDQANLVIDELKLQLNWQTTSTM